MKKSTLGAIPPNEQDILKRGGRYMTKKATARTFGQDLMSQFYQDDNISVDVAHKTLAERFIVPPFSVLDARQGYWQDRKRAWLALGIRSELGRGGG